MSAGTGASDASAAAPTTAAPTTAAPTTAGPDRRPAPPDGLVVVDKPAGLTSHDVVARLRRILGTRKVGHAGTLDPAATGVLVCGVGRGTKLLGHLALRDKEYLATARLGRATSTDDAEGEPLGEPMDGEAVTDAALDAALAPLHGVIQQVPSSVSAVKVDGRRAYARVRAGEDVVLPARTVDVAALEVTGRRGADVDLRVVCSSGTYVRAIARDLGTALGCGAHLVALRRTRVGPFDLTGAATLDEVDVAAVIGLDRAVGDSFPRRLLDADDAGALRHGRPLEPTGTTEPVGAFDPDGRVLALLQDRDGQARPLVVLAPA